jgi:GNAT superfamily N-acetyltransferase
VRIAPRYLCNPVDVWTALKPELEWVVAEAESGGLIGAAQVTLGETEVEGERHEYAGLSSLMVHPDHRRRGVAAALTRWRLDRAGPDAVVAAAIQAGNVSSVANARGWATQIFGRLTIPVFSAKPRSTIRPGLEIREPGRDDEWDRAAAGLEAFEPGWSLRAPTTSAAMRDRASRAFEGRRLQRYFIAIEGGEVCGGFELFEGAQLQTIVFEHAPLLLHALNLLVRVVPRDRELRENSLSRVWYLPGRDDVARALWEAARSAAAESGNAVGMQVDLRTPLRRVLPVRPWTLKATASVAVRSPVRLDEDRFLSPP